MKKFISFMLILAVSAILVSVFSSCGKDKTPETPENTVEMVDYADNVYLNTEKYSDLNDQGMHIVSWNTETKTLIETKTDTEAAKLLYDSSKPTVIFVHGLLMDAGRYGHEMYILPNEMIAVGEISAEDTASNGTVYCTKFWLDEGWNVLTFQYNRFSDADMVTVEDRVYSAEDGLSYMNAEGEVSSNDASQYSIGQFFAAEYIRTVENFNVAEDKEIRVACHSMGGVVTVNGSRILVALAEDGQIAQNLLPNRIALLDTYCGFISTFDVSFDTVSWSGESMEGKTKSGLYYEYVKAVAGAGTTIELYVMENGVVPTASADGIILKVMDYTTTLIYSPAMYTGFDYIGKGHNGVREWYMCSVSYGVPLIEGTTELGISANTSIARLIELKGKIYMLSSDDLFIDTHTETEATRDDYVVFEEE